MESFLEKLSDKQRASIRAVGIDRAGAYQSVISEWLPNADIVYDRFHLVMNVNQAVDEVRRNQWRQASGEWRKLLKGHRFLVLSNRDNLDSSGEEKLSKLMEANKALATAYVLKEQFRAIFTFRTLDWAQRVLKNWREMAA